MKKIICGERVFLVHIRLKKLVDTLLYSLELNFALRIGEEHIHLRVGMKKLKMGIYRKTKTDSWNTKRIYRKLIVVDCHIGNLNRAYVNCKDPRRCKVSIFDIESESETKRRKMLSTIFKAKTKPY